MPSQFQTNAQEDLTNTVVNEAISDGQLGLGVWNLTQQTFTLSENITGYSPQIFHSLFHFIEKVSHKKDRSLALIDLLDYMKSPDEPFRSTFRIQTKDQEIKWILLKGKLQKETATGDQLFQVLFYDVSGKNFKSGNDYETNSLNREFFIKKLEKAILHQYKNEKSAIMGVSISNYQSILDIYGSWVMKKLFREVSILLNQILAEDSEVAKFSTENFVCMLHNVKNKQHVRQLTDSIVQAFRTPLNIDEQLIQVEVNLGVTIFPDDSTDATELLIFGEYATQQSKQKGKYQTIFFNNKLSNELHEHLLIEKELVTAVQNKEIYLMYQPQIDSSTGQTIGIEALVRWENEKLGFVSPGTFIPIAETHGYMIEIGDFILEESIRTAKVWHEKGYAFGTISVNISPVELGGSRFMDRLIALCEKYQLPHDLLEIEITEGVYMHSIENSLGIVRTLIEEGFKIAVDDFGTGYSNLAFLAQAELDTLKIDKSLIDILDNPSGYLVVEGIVKLAKSLNYQVLAEGVETEDQVTVLSKMGCQNIQGYYYSKPLIPGEMKQMLKHGGIK